MNLSSLNRRLVIFFDFNRTIVFSIALKLWQAGVGLLGLFFIGRYFAPEVQGFYYTFSSLVALQSFVELGLYLLISNFASHEWSKLFLTESGEIDGDAQALSRLVSLGRFVFKWYASAAFVFFLFGWVAGYWFLSNDHATDINWQLPWLFHIVCSSLLLWCMPFLSLLEGCGQIEGVAKFRVVQSVVANAGFWAVIYIGGNLWAATALSSISAVMCIFYLTVVRRMFFNSFFKITIISKIDWKAEILPMQWRLGVQGIMNYFVFSLFTPVLFRYHGATAAGQMGMSLQLVTAVQAVASIWILTKAPGLGVLIARGDYPLLDLEWRRATIMAIAIMIIGCLVLLATIIFANSMHLEFSSRMLSPLNFALLLLGALFSLAGQSISIYLRAHKREVLTSVGVVSGLVMALLVWQLGKLYGPIGVCASYLFVFSCVTMPMMLIIWKNAKLNWHLPGKMGH